MNVSVLSSIDQPLLLSITTLFGLIIGSFLNVVILRLPDPKQSIVYPGSHCPHCNSALHWYENIPLFSYLVQLGRCRSCSVRISLQYPLVEIASGFLAAATVLHFGLTWVSLAYFIFSAALLVIIVIDIYHQIIPDVISLPGILLGLIFSLFSPTITWQSSLIGLLAGGGVLYTIALAYYLLRKVDGMGGGDIKLLAMLGAWLGWQSLPFVIFVSSASGALIGILAMLKQKKGGHTRIPFGPFLSIAALTYLFYSDEILYFYYLYITGQWP